jgi:hypothetical protein
MLDLVFLLWFVSKAFLRGAILEIFSGRLWETTEAFEINGDADEGVSAGEVTVTGDLDMLTAGWAIGDAGGEGGELALPLMSIDIETTDFAYKKEQVALALGFSERCSIGTMKLGTVALPGSGGVPLVLVLWAAPANADALPDMSKFAADLKKDVEKVLSRSGEEEEEEEGAEHSESYTTSDMEGGVPEVRTWPGPCNGDQQGPRHGRHRPPAKERQGGLLLHFLWSKSPSHEERVGRRRLPGAGGHSPAWRSCGSSAGHCPRDQDERGRSCAV